MKQQYMDAEHELFGKRVLELMSAADRGEASLSEFLDPQKIHYAKVILNGAGHAGRFAFFGGYRDAERARIVCLPDYALYDVSDGDEDALWRTASSYAEEDVAVLRIYPSGYKKLTHRDYMGSILALGIKRSFVGDILVDEEGAYVFCDCKIAEYIATNLIRVGRDAITVRKTVLPTGFAAQKRTEPITDTVASMRADAVIAALINCSRERAKEYLRAGLCELDYEVLYKPDAVIAAGSILSVRGKGKFIIRGTDGVTRSGRLRLFAEKYV